MKNTMLKITNAAGSLNFISVDSKVANEFVNFAKENNAIVHGVFEAGEMPFEQLPDEIKDRAKMILRAYPNCTVVYESGKFSISVGSCIKANYKADHFVCGKYTDKEIYTLEERRQNYREEFGSEPRF